MRLNESLSIFFIKRTSSEVPETPVTNARDQPCIHGARDCIFSMHGTYAGRRRGADASAYRRSRSRASR